MSTTTTANAKINDLLAAGWLAHAVSAAARLGVADALAPGPATAEVLATRLGCHAPSLERLLRALAVAGVVEMKDALFSLSATGEALLDRPGSARAFAALQSSEPGLRAFAHLADAVRTGEPGFRIAHGADFFAWLPAHPDTAREFAAGMQSSAGVDVTAIAAVADFGRFRRFVDVGGGRGALLDAALAAAPDATGTLFDLPHVVAGAGARPRVERVGGSVFDAVPGGGDAYLLKSVLHDFDDDKAAAILRRVRAAAPSGATLLVCERLVGDDGYARALDVVMLTLLGGRERTEAEYRALLTAAGFDVVDVRGTSSPVSVIEARGRS